MVGSLSRSLSFPGKEQERIERESKSLKNSHRASLLGPHFQWFVVKFLFLRILNKIPFFQAESNSTNIKEGSAEIISGGNVFYNPVQEFNRDLSISVLNVYFKILQEERSKSKNNNSQAPQEEPKAGVKCENGMRILEALSATGLRSIRYAKEIAGVKEIVANDLSKPAVKSIEENVKYNEVESLITPSHNDAM